MNLFVFDIDGTLIDKDLILPKKTIEVLNKLLDAGNAVAFASGRAYQGAFKFMKHLKESKNKYIIASNGSVIYDYKGDILDSHYIKMKDYVDIYNEFSKEQDFCIMLYQNNMIGYVNNPSYVKIEERSNDMKSFVVDLSNVDLNENIEKVMIESHLIENTNIVIPTSFKERFNVVQGSPHFLEFSHKLADKARGVEFLRNYLRIDPKNIYTFGDSGNDYLMIKNYNGICMGNGFSECKKVAKYVTKPVWENGVVFYLENVLKLM